MSSIANRQMLKTSAKTAAACTICMAVASAGLPAEVVSFQQQRASLPPIQNVNSAPCSRKSACHFGGSIANYAVIANQLQHLLQFSHLFTARSQSALATDFSALSLSPNT